MVFQPGWYPDPAKRHDHRWWDGTTWSDAVSDGGEGSDDPLGPPPAGLIAWLGPEMTQPAARVAVSDEVPRFKIWAFALLSALFLILRAGSSHIVLPLGLAFAVACWVETGRVLRSLDESQSSLRQEMIAARVVSTAALALCAFGTLSNYL